MKLVQFTNTNPDTTFKGWKMYPGESSTHKHEIMEQYLTMYTFATTHIWIEGN